MAAVFGFTGVYRDTYPLILKIFEVTKYFPKDYTFTLGQDMKRDALQRVSRLYRANRSARIKEHLENFLDDFDCLNWKNAHVLIRKWGPIKNKPNLRS